MDHRAQMVHAPHRGPARIEPLLKEKDTTMSHGITGKRLLRQIEQRLWLSITLLLALTPVLTQAQGATPPTDMDSTALHEMLARVPASLPHLENPAQAIISYADIAAQLDAVGVAPPDSVAAEEFNQWVGATWSLALPMPAARYMSSWHDDFGFDLTEVDQSLSIALPPFDLTLYRGRFNAEEVIRHLEDIRYRPIEVDGHVMVSVRGDFEQDLTAPTGYTLATMNFAVALDDGTLAFASAGAPLAAVLNVAAGQRPSLMDQAGIATMVASAPVDLVSAVLVHGAGLASGVPASLLDVAAEGRTPDISAIATEIAEAGRMPPVAMALLGSTAGGPLEIGDESLALPADTPDARAVALLLMLTPEAADTAAAIVDERLATASSERLGQPFSQMFPERDVRVVPGTSVVLVDLTLGDGLQANILTQMLYSRDLGFLAW
jgi:hypothetical protein